MIQYVVSEGQTILDVATEVYGTCDRALDLVIDNNLAGLTALVHSGQILILRDSGNQVATYFSNRNKRVNTGPISSDYKPGGIGYMQIGNDFIVS